MVELLPEAWGEGSPVGLAWYPLGNGRLALFHRPGLKAFGMLRQAGCTRLVTLLSAREDAVGIGQRAEHAGMEWTWLPLQNGTPPLGEAAQMLSNGLYGVLKQVLQGDSVVIHCSAGIHRTGMAAYALLRMAGIARDEALEAIAQMRMHTRAGLKPGHMEWGEQAFEKMQTGENWMSEEICAPFARSYWVVPGKLLAGCYPGDLSPEEAEIKLRGLAASRVSRVVNLMEELERDSLGRSFIPYQDRLSEILAEMGGQVSHVRYEIEDGSIPEREKMRAILDDIDATIGAGGTVYVHCWGGVGRTGTVVGCYLARHGIAAGQQVLDRLAELRREVRPYREAPEYEPQREMIRSWKVGE